MLTERNTSSFERRAKANTTNEKTLNPEIEILTLKI